VGQPQGHDVTLTRELLQRIRDGDDEAWTALYQRYRDELLFAVRCRLGPGLRACLQSEDVLQSVMLDALGALPRLKEQESGRLRHYLHVMVTNKIRDRADTFGAQKRRGSVPLTEDLAIALPGMEPLAYADADRFESLERCLLLLPDDQREVILLRRVDGLSSQEAAEVLGRSDAAVRKLFSRAMASLTRLLQDAS
jgi:RNA polymerase sigma-70 factor (ECF subfamily)